MAVELQRTRESLFPSSSLNENDVVSLLDLQSFESLESDQSEIASSETESSDCMADHLTLDKTNNKESWDFGGWPFTTGIWSPLGSSHGSAEDEETTSAIEKRHVVFDNKYEKKANNNLEVPKYPPSSSDARFRRNQAPTSLDNQIKAIQLFKLKQELLLKQRGLRENNNNNSMPLFEKSEKRHVQNGNKKIERARQQSSISGSGMRAVFLDGPGSKAGPSCGTGVFLPCVIGDTSSRSRKKKGCSPVLIPAKVMEALKDHFDRMDNLSRQNNNGVNFPKQRDDTYNQAPKNNSQKKRQSRTTPAVNQNDMGLPQDWTY